MSKDVETWLQDLGDPNEIFWVQTEPSSPNSHRIDNAVKIMQKHFQRRSRGSSPTLHQPKRSWYSAPPLLQMYDKEVINVLLNVARGHLATVFRIFSDFQATKDTTHELCLAMAAVGGLYSSVEGSTTIAKSLYNDARRIHLEKTYSRPPPSSFDLALDSVKTFILLAIYGICSGDKRSYEFVEVYHLTAMEAIQHCLQMTPSNLESAQHRELLMTFEAVDILESYFVVLLQRPPYHLSLPIDRKQQLSSYKLDMTSLFQPAGPLTSITGSLREVANLSTYTWATSPRGEEHSRVQRLWNPEFIELALERWVNVKQSSMAVSDLPSILIYHLSHLHLQINFGILQRSSHDFVKASEASSEKIFDTIRNCICAPSFKVAVWHAYAILRVVREMIAVSGRRQLQVSEQLHRLEPPHLPYCIYFATLILWYHEYVEKGPISSTREACLETGIHLLSMLKVQVAKVLANALCELFPEEIV